MAITCTHLQDIDPKIKPKTQGCEEGEKTGERWVAIRKCLTCGHVGCCDSSIGRHARQHFQETGHPIIDSYQPEGRWQWCYIDNDYVDVNQAENDFDEKKAIVLD